MCVCVFVSPKEDKVSVGLEEKYLVVGVPTRGPGSQLVNAACFLVPDVDARGNTVAHGFILVPTAGPYVQ